MFRIAQILVTRLALGASMATLLAATAGCGQQGPLYLPTEPASVGRATLPQTLNPGGILSPASPVTPGGTPPAAASGATSPVAPASAPR